MPSWGQNTGKSIIDKDNILYSAVVGVLYNNPHIANGKIRQYLEAEHSDRKLPSKKSIQVWVKQWKVLNRQLWLYMTNPDKWKNACKVAFGSHHERIKRLNQVWELDSTPGDWMLTDGRHTVVGIIDLYSSRLKLLVSKSSTAAAVCQVFRRALLDWGVPEIARTDNGKDYVSDQFTTVLHTLELTHELCDPFASEQKGTIERALGTMSHGILDLLPGFIGHNVAERSVIEARKSFAHRIMHKDDVVEVSISSEQLQEKLDQWVEYIYQRDEHGGLNNKTPFEVATAWIGEVRRIEDERALDILLAEKVGRNPKFGKKGVRYNNQFYFNEKSGHPNLIMLF